MIRARCLNTLTPDCSTRRGDTSYGHRKLHSHLKLWLWTSEHRSPSEFAVQQRTFSDPRVQGSPRSEVTTDTTMASFDLVCSEGLDDAFDVGRALSGLPTVDDANGQRCKRKLSDTYRAAGSGWDLLVCNSGDRNEEGCSDSARSSQVTPPWDLFGLRTPSKRKLEAREVDATCFSKGSAPSSTGNICPL